MQEQRLSRNELQQGLASAPLSESLWSAEAVPAEWPVMELRMSMFAFCSAAGRADSCGDSAPNSFAYPLRAHNPMYVSYVFLHTITGFTRVSALSSSILSQFPIQCATRVRLHMDTLITEAACSCWWSPVPHCCFWFGPSQPLSHCGAFNLAPATPHENAAILH